MELQPTLIHCHVSTQKVSCMHKYLILIFIKGNFFDVTHVKVIYIDTGEETTLISTLKFTHSWAKNVILLP